MRNYILVLILCFTSCQKDDMQFTQHGIIGSVSASGDTSPDGHQVFGIIGDSNADGRGATIPTVSSGIFYDWNGSSYDEITTQSVSNDDNTKGSIWQQFATDYNTATSYKVNILNGASGGAKFYPDGIDNNNWYTSGTLYSAFTTEMAQALAARGLTKPKAIFINLGINDVRVGTSQANIETGVTSLMSRLTTDFPGVPIIMLQIGRTESDAHTVALYDVRAYLVTTSRNNTDVYLLDGPTAAIAISGGYNGDNLHYSQTTNNAIGSCINRWFQNSSYAKWPRSIIASMFDDLSTTRKDLISAFVSAQITSGNFWLLEHLSVYKTTTQNNIHVDWSFLGYMFNNTTISFTANSHIASNGTSNHYAVTFNAAVNDSRASQDDFVHAVKVKTNNTAQGTLCCALGASDGSDIIAVLQNTTPALTYRANDATINTTTAELKFGNDALYGLARNGTTKYLIKDAGTLASTTQASTGTMNQLPTFGTLITTVGSFL